MPVVIGFMGLILLAHQVHEYSLPLVLRWLRYIHDSNLRNYNTFYYKLEYAVLVAIMQAIHLQLLPV